MAVFTDTLEPTATAADSVGKYGDNRARTVTGLDTNNKYDKNLRFGGFIDTKGPDNIQSTCYLRYEMAIPSYASIDKAKLLVRPAVTVAPSALGIRVGLLELDDKWDLMAGASVHHIQKTVPYFIVRGDSGTVAVQGNNGGENVLYPLSDVGFTYTSTMGGSVLVGTALSALEEISLDMSFFGIPSGDVRIELYNTVSATDPRPTGSIIATSDDFPISSFTAWPASSFVNFLFSGGDQILLSVGQRFAFKLVDALDTSTIDEGVHIRMDSGYNDAFENGANSSLDDDNFLLIWSSIPQNGFPLNVYFTDQDIPRPMGKDSNTLIPGVVFNERFPGFAQGTVWDAGVDREWGTTGYAAHGNFALHEMISDWMLEPGYDPTGSPIGVVFRENAASPPIYRQAFSEDTGQAVRLVIEYSFDAPTAPTDPIPADTAVNVPLDQILSWTAGLRTETYDVYFGTDSTPDAGEVQGNQSGVSFDPGTLIAGTTYYWRIDAINDAGTTTGTVWSFTTVAGSTLEDGGDVIQQIVEACGDATQVLLEVGGDTLLTIIEDGEGVFETLVEDGEDVIQRLIEDGGDVTSEG